MTHEAARPYRACRAFPGGRGPTRARRRSTRCWPRCSRGCTCSATIIDSATRCVRRRPLGRARSGVAFVSADRRVRRLAYESGDSTIERWSSRRFSQELDRRVLVCDGAMGTMLYARGIFLNRSFDELNLTQPDLVAEVHQAYVRAGADVIETNTFGANRVKLGAFGLADRVARDQHAGGAHRASRGARSGLCRRRDRPARHSHRAVGQDRRRRSGGVSSRSRRARCSKAASTSSSSRPSATSTRSARRSAPCGQSAICRSSRR